MIADHVPRYCSAHLAQVSRMRAFQLEHAQAWYAAGPSKVISGLVRRGLPHSGHILFTAPNQFQRRGRHLSRFLGARKSNFTSRHFGVFHVELRGRQVGRADRGKKRWISTIWPVGDHDTLPCVPASGKAHSRASAILISSPTRGLPRFHRRTSARRRLASCSVGGCGRIGNGISLPAVDWKYGHLHHAPTSAPRLGLQGCRT